MTNDILESVKEFFYSIQKDWIRIFSSISMIAFFLLFWAAPVCSDDGKPDKLFIGHFSRGKFDNWEKKVFTGESRYKLVEVDGQTVLKGMAKNSASGLFKKEIRYVDAVAIMTDSDNSGGVVLAYYGDIFFSSS